MFVDYKKEQQDAPEACLIPQTDVWPPSTCEQELPGAAASDPQVIIYRLPGLFGQLEPNRAPGLLLSNARAVEPLGATSSTRTATTSQPRSLLYGQVKEGKVFGSALIVTRKTTDCIRMRESAMIPKR